MVKYLNIPDSKELGGILKLTVFLNLFQNLPSDEKQMLYKSSNLLIYDEIQNYSSHQNRALSSGRY